MSRRSKIGRTTYTVPEVAAMWVVHPQTVRALIHRGQLRALMVGGQYRIRRVDLDAFERANLRNRCSTRPDAERRDA